MKTTEKIRYSILRWAQGLGSQELLDLLDDFAELEVAIIGAKKVFDERMAEIKKVLSSQQDAAARFKMGEISHQRENQALQLDLASARAVMEQIAEYCPGSLDDIGGGTLVRVSLKVQLIKDARRWLEEQKQ